MKSLVTVMIFLTSFNSYSQGAVAKKEMTFKTVNSIYMYEVDSTFKPLKAYTMGNYGLINFKDDKVKFTVFEGQKQVGTFTMKTISYNEGYNLEGVFYISMQLQNDEGSTSFAVNLYFPPDDTVHIDYVNTFQNIIICFKNCIIVEKFVPLNN